MKKQFKDLTVSEFANLHKEYSQLHQLIKVWQKKIEEVS